MTPGTALALAFTLLMWGSAFAGIRAALVDYSPWHLALLRYAAASLTLVPVALIRRIRLPERRDLPRLLLLGLSGITFYHLALNYGEQTVTAGTACFIVNLSPIFTALLALVFLGERLRPAGWLGLAACLAGISLIWLGEGGDQEFNAGVLAILGCAVSAAVYFVVQKPLLPRYGALAVASYAMWFGTLPMLVFLPGLGRAVAAARPASTLTVLYLGVFPAALAYAAWSYVLKSMPAARAASLLYLAPLVAIAFGWLWLGEVPGPLALAGGVLSLAGVAVVNTLGREATRPAAAAPTGR